MNPHSEFTHFAGFDWASDHHDIIVQDRSGHVVDDFQIPHSAAGWRLWREKIAAYPMLAVAIETSFGIVVDQLLESKVVVYPVNPVSARRYRERKHPSGAKTDRHDAWALADALRMDGHGWRPLGPKDCVVEELRILCRDELALIEERTALINQLRQALSEYYPTALEAFDDWTLPSAWAFIQRFPSSQALTKAGKRQWERFLHSHKLARPQTYAMRLDVFEKAHQWPFNPGMVKAKSLYAQAKICQLRALQTQLDEYRLRIQQLFSSHPDSGLFGSLPGAGSKLAPRLLGEIGSDRSLFTSAQGLQCVAGTAPTSFQSGKIRKAQIRRCCNHVLRHAMHLFAFKSIDQSPWAKVYYDTLRQKGKTHPAALRCLGQRWLKIIWKMWQTRSPYDPQLHLNNQLAHGSWILKISQA